ncbi:uncharacterized protein LOC135340143 [Halichondria panicea]|uniref:uncharacterized protein LOC135340143 n=1 Tax=Halichondria panicea TaxID=6063 RepID=UPI00312BBD02
MQPKVLLNALKTSSFVRLVVATRLKHSSTDPLEDVLPQKWTELGERIQKQVIATGYEHLLARRACVKESLAKRGMETDIVDQLLKTLERHNLIVERVKSLDKERKNNHETFNAAQSEEEKSLAKDRGVQLKRDIAKFEEERRELKDKMMPVLTQLPNEVHPHTPVGGYKDSRVVEEHGQKRKFSFPVKSHIEIGNQLDLYDYRGSSSASVNGFCYLKGAAAMLEMALVQFALQTAVSKGYTPVIPPDIIRTEMVEGCGFQPRGPSSQVFHVTSNHHRGTNLCLAGTAELPLAGMFVGKNVPFKQLPIRLVAFGRCYRAEAGGSTLLAKGLYRLHQFSKVELFGVTSQETGRESVESLEDMLSVQKEILSSLGLHYRVLEMATAELGAPAYRKYDVEVWMPGRGEYGEVTSASNCTDYQSRRLSITYPNQDGRRDKRGVLETKYAHTVNATGCAVPRVIISLLENYQQEDGSVLLPHALRPFLPEQYWTIR